MRLQGIYSLRKFQSRYAMDLVYEWEDVLSQELSLPLKKNIGGIRKISGGLSKFAPFVWNWVAPRKPVLEFVLKIGLYDCNICERSGRNIIPVIVDFLIKDENQLKRFYERYSGCPVVLITSMDAFRFLKMRGCPLNIRHWALSLSDKYRITVDTHFEKKYDCVVVGGVEPVFLEWLRIYGEKHPDFYYVYCKNADWRKRVYCSSRGESLGAIANTREEYLALLRQARIGLYSTPNIDGRRSDAVGFDWVTPRLLEYLACGCHILGRYPERNADVEWWRLPEFMKNIKTYGDFEKAVDIARHSDVDIKRYVEYLNRHYTSVRARQLDQILGEY